MHDNSGADDIGFAGHAPTHSEITRFSKYRPERGLPKILGICAVIPLPHISHTKHVQLICALWERMARVSVKRK